MTQNPARWVMAFVLAAMASVCPAQNVALNKPVSVVAGEANGAAPSTLTDGSFRPRGTGYQDGTVWWTSLTTTFEIDLRGVFVIAGLIAQADDNDAYTVLYRRVSDNSWQVAWNVPNVDALGNGMQTRPDPANDGTAFVLPATVETDRLRIVAASGDSAFSLAEVQAIAAPSTQCAADWRFAQIGSRANAAAAFDIQRGRAVLFGGYSRDNPPALGDTWVRFSGAEAWTTQDVLGPASRSRHAMAYDAVRQRVVLFGGQGAQGRLADTWEWDGSVWLRHTGSVGPSARYGHSMAYDAARQRVVLFGGFGGPEPGARLADTWTWDGTAWTPATPGGSNPSARYDSALAYADFSQRVVLVGGNTGVAGVADVWEWNGATWTQRTTPGGAGWGARAGHAMAYDQARGRIVLFGGTAGSAALSDVWEWAGGAWTTVAATGPEARSGHAMFFDAPASRVVVYGGTGSRSFADTWEWNGVAWTPRIEAVPSSRSQHAMVEDSANGRLLMFGGITALGDSNETWRWDGQRWQQLNVTGPNARYGHAMAYDLDRGKVVLFGGSVFGGISQDTHEWDGSAWTARTNLPGTLPPRRSGHAMVYDALNRRTVLFGGSGAGLTADTWSFDGTQWSILVPAGTGRPAIRNAPAMTFDSLRNQVLLFGGRGSGQTRFNDTWVLEGAAWREISIPQANRPAARGSAAFSFDSSRGTAILTGGSGPTANLSDTWEWNGVIWSQVQIPSPGARQSAAMAYDSVRQRMSLFGGTVGNNQYAADTWVRNSSSLDAPIITSQPQNLAAASNEPAEFFVITSNALSYRWRRNGVYISDGPAPGGGLYSGTATPTLRISVVGLPDVGTYDVVVINTCGATLSTPASLTVEHGPDLVVTAVQSDPPNGLNGDPVTIRWTIMNIGDRAAPAGFVDRVYITPVSPAGSESAVSGFVSAPPALNPGESYSQTYNTTFPNPAGSIATYRYTVRTDVRQPQNVLETREDNNALGSADVPVVVPPPGDLTPGDLSAPATVLFGAQFAISWNELNQGGIIRRAWNSRVVLSQNEVFGDSDDRVLATPASSASRLPNGQVAPFSVNATIPYDLGAMEGTYYLIVRSDIGSVVAESDENNNTIARSVMLRFPQRPDLLVADSSAPIEGLTEQSFQISWTVRNDGNALATGWNDRAYLSTNATYESGDPPLGPDLPAPRTLAPGETYQRTQQYNFPVTPGTYYLIIRTDTGSAVVESPLGEQNNVRVHATPILVRQFPKPDLQITSVTPVSSGVISGQTITVRFQVSNLGTGPTTSPSWRDAIFLLSPDQQFGTSCLSGFTFLGEGANPSYLPAPGNNDNRYEQIVQVALPHDITGTYKIGIATDARRQGCPGWSVGQPGDVSELVENNNAAYSPTFTIELEPQPDMQVQSVGIDGPSIAFSGQNIAALRTIVNREGDPPRGGVTDVGTWTDRLYLSTHNRAEPPNTGAGDIVLADVGGGSGVLQPGQTFGARTTHRLPANISGFYFIKCQTDLTGRISEFGFEGNNIGVSTAPIDIRLTPPPDLEPTAAAFTGPTVVVPQQVVSFTWAVENFGAPPQTDVSWSDGAYLSADATLSPGTDPLMTRPGASSGRDEQNQPIINPYSRNADYRLSGTIAAGDYRLIVRTDDQGSIFEATDGEANNVRVSSNMIRVEARYADLVITVDGTPTPSGHAGARGTIGWRVSNNGVVPTQIGNWVDRVWFNTTGTPGGTVLTTQSHNGALGIEDEYTGAYEFAVPLVGPGLYFVVIAVDADNGVAEGPGEANNVIAVPFTVTAEAADLAAVAVAAPPTGNADETIAINWTIENRGVLPTNVNSWIDRIYLSRNPNLTGAIEIGARTRTQPLSPSQDYSDQGNFSLPRESSGLYYVLVRTDTNGAVFESNEANNTGPQSPPTITVRPIDVDPPTYPNLEAISVEAPSQATESQPFELSWTVANTGQAAIAASRTWRDSFYLSRDQFFDPPQSGGLGDIYIGTFTRHGPVPGSGGRYDATASPVLPAGVAGPYFVIVRADAGGDIDEGGREGDNTTVAANLTLISIAPLSDLTVASVTPPATAELGAAAPFAWSVRNSGLSTIRATWQDSLFLSADPTWSIDDRRIGNFPTNPSIGPIAPDENVGGSASPRVPGVTPGEYYVVTRADVLNQVPETNEGNNSGASAQTVRLDAQTLALDAPHSFTLSSGEESYFRILLPPGVAVRCKLSHDSLAAATELFVRRGAVPTLSEFDAAFDRPGNRNQTIAIGRTSADTYYILARATSGAGGALPSTATIEVEGAEFGVDGVSPSIVGNSGDATLTIRGTRFDEYTRFALVQGTTRVEATTTYFVRSTLVHATFSMLGVAPGDYDLEIRSAYIDWTVTPPNPELQFVEVGSVLDATLSNAVYVADGGGGALRYQSILPPSVRVGNVFPIDVEVSNEGSNDLPVPVLSISSSNRTPISADNSPARFQSFEEQVIVIGARNPRVLAPGEVAIVRVFARADVTPVARLHIRELADSPAQIDWAAEESRYRDRSLPEEWGRIWSNFVGIAGSSSSDLHQAMRAALGVAAFERRRSYITGAEAMGILLASAKRGVRSSERLGGPSGGVFFGPAFERGGRYGPRGGCPCVPYTDSTEAEDAEEYLNLWVLPALGVWFGDSVFELWLDYLNNVPPNASSRPFSESSEVGQAFKESSEIFVDSMAVLGEIYGALGSMRCDQLQDGPVALSSILTAAQRQRDIDFRLPWTIPGNIAGGISNADDARTVSGTVDFTQWRDPVCGRLLFVTAEVRLHYDITETVDFCPGGLGAPLEQAVATEAMCRLEASGRAFDAKYTVSFDAPELPLIYIPLDRSTCPDPCRANSPAERCAYPCPELICGGGGGGDPCDDPPDEVPVQQAVDPNEKAGPSGFGVERWIPNATIPYRIYFENLPAATAPASLVTVTDDLSTDLIPGSFRLGRIQIADRTIEIPTNRISYSTTIDLRATRGVLLEIVAGVDTSVSPPRAFWRLQSIDPSTGLPPVTGDLGFLPPNDETGRGEGYVEFTIRPRTSVVSGTVIRNDATIVFDNNEPIRTNVVSNTIDSEAPVSMAGTVPAASPPGPVTLEIAAGDLPGGSGLAGARLFVSRDGGAYQPVTSLSFDQQAIAILETGHVYRFTTQSTDNAGNIEPLPGAPDAITTTLAITLEASSDTGISGDNRTNDRTPTLTVVGPPESVVQVRLSGPVEVSGDVRCGSDGRGEFTVPETRQLADGQYTIIVNSGTVTSDSFITIDATAPVIHRWQTLAAHGSVGDVAIAISGDSTVEPRTPGVARLRYIYGGDVPDSTIPTPDRVIVTGIDALGRSIDLSSIQITTAPNLVVGGIDILFTPALPDRARYCVRVEGVRDAAGNPLAGSDRVAITALSSDSTSDFRTNNTDAGAIQSLIGTNPINPIIERHVRSDLNTDGQIDAADRLLALQRRGVDLRFIPSPCPGGRPGGDGPLVDTSPAPLDPDIPPPGLRERPPVRVLRASISSVASNAGTTHRVKASAAPAEAPADPVNPADVMGGPAPITVLATDTDGLTAGYLAPDADTTAAALWSTETGIVDLNDLLTPAEGWRLLRADGFQATDTPSTRLITGEGTFQGVPTRFGLTIMLIAEAGGDLDGNGVVDEADLTVLLTFKASGDPCCDVDGDGLINNADVEALITLISDK